MALVDVIRAKTARQCACVVEVIGVSSVSTTLYHLLAALFGKWHLPLPCIRLRVCSVSTRMRLFLYISVCFIISQVMAQSLEEIQKEYSEGMT